MTDEDARGPRGPEAIGVVRRRTADIGTGGQIHRNGSGRGAQSALRARAACARCTCPLPGPQAGRGLQGAGERRGRRSGTGDGDRDGDGDLDWDQLRKAAPWRGWGPPATRACPSRSVAPGVGDTEPEFRSCDTAQGGRYSRLPLRKSTIRRNVSSFQSLLKGHCLQETRWPHLEL